MQGTYNPSIVKFILFIIYLQLHFEEEKAPVNEKQSIPNVEKHNLISFFWKDSKILREKTKLLNH